jgi:hypothetical protein
MRMSESVTYCVLKQVRRRKTEIIVLNNSTVTRSVRKIVMLQAGPNGRVSGNGNERRRKTFIIALL